MKERPILFSAEMVRAILDGRKTQTRRVIVPSRYMLRYTKERHGGFDSPSQANQAATSAAMAHLSMAHSDRLPYGQAGDRLWVRENGWEPKTPSIDEIAGGADTWPTYEYDANGITEANAEDYRTWGWKRRPSIHMPRWASRLTLEVTDVRIERLQAISVADCIAEGVRIPTDEGRPLLQISGKYPPCAYAPFNSRHTIDSATLTDWLRAYWASLWDNRNAKRGYGWSTDPWVWVVEFRRVEQQRAAA